jgi:hypothetical protein
VRIRKCKPVGIDLTPPTVIESDLIADAVEKLAPG